MKILNTAAILFALLTTSATANDYARPKITGVSHISIYSSDVVKTDYFYTHDIGAKPIKNKDATRYYVSPKQFIEVKPLPLNADPKKYLNHVAFATDDAVELYNYLKAKNYNVPSSINIGNDGSKFFSVNDPEGNEVEFYQNPKTLPNVPTNPILHHIMHVGYIIHDRSLEDTFFRDILGFRPYWFGGFEEDKPTWVSQQVPDGTDWIEYMIAGSKDTHGIPEDMSKETAGVLNHFSFGVKDIRETYTYLWNNDRLKGQDANLPKIGRDAKWQLNLFDPDGTRAEIMELKAIGKPCCSPFTASDPTQ